MDAISPRATSMLLEAECRPSPSPLSHQAIDKRYPANERGDMLVFLSGANEITALAEEVNTELDSMNVGVRVRS